MVWKVGFLQARILGSTSNGSRWRHHLLWFSTGANYSAEVTPRFMVDYLRKALTFSRDDAIIIATKLCKQKQRRMPDLAVDYLKRIGMEVPHIKAAVAKYPRLLFSDLDKNIHPKILCLNEFGLSGSDLVSFIASDSFFLARGFETHIKPILRFIRQASGSKKKAVEALKRSYWFFAHCSFRAIQANIMVLRDKGLSDKKILHFGMTRQICFSSSNGWLCKILKQVETEYGICRSSPMFYHVLCVAATLKSSTIDKKLEIFRSFGWSDSDISTTLQKQPSCLSLSEAKLGKTLNFLTKELGYGSDYLAARPVFLVHSLEKNIIPWSRVLKILQENQINVCSLFSAVTMSKSRFLEIYVLPYKDKLPDMHQRYITSSTPSENMCFIRANKLD